SLLPATGLIKDADKFKLMLLAWNYQNSAAAQNGGEGPDLATMTNLWQQYQNALAMTGKTSFNQLPVSERQSSPIEQQQDETNSSEQKDEDDLSEDDSEDRLEATVNDPERLKAFNMFVRLFVDENLDRIIPISKQPKEKIQAIIDSCTRQFPEFAERARKRIRTYLKSCRRNKKTREGWENTSRPTPAHLTSVQAEQILAVACENESLNAKRMRIGLEPISQTVSQPAAVSFMVKWSLPNASRAHRVHPSIVVVVVACWKGVEWRECLATALPRRLPFVLGNHRHPHTHTHAQNHSKRATSILMAPMSNASRGVLVCSFLSLPRSLQTSAESPTAVPTMYQTLANREQESTSVSTIKSEPMTSVPKISPVPSTPTPDMNQMKLSSTSSGATTNTTMSAAGTGELWSQLSDCRPSQTPESPKGYPPCRTMLMHRVFSFSLLLSLIIAAAPTDLSMKRPILAHKLNSAEITAVKQLVTGYRESAAFLMRSADELENLLLQQQ
ncbi:AGAP008187-PA, partial [Anopheles gambiae str. PEST]